MKFIVFCFLLSSIILSAQNSLIDQETRGGRRGPHSIKRSDASVLKGKDSYRKGNYQEAFDHYCSALLGLPQGPVVQERRRACTKLYVQAAIELSKTKAKENKLTESNKLLLDALINCKSENKYIVETLSSRFRSKLPLQCYLVRAMGF